VLSGSIKGWTQRGAQEFLGALLLLAACSLAQAAGLSDPNARQFAPSRGHSTIATITRPLLLRLAAPPLMATPVSRAPLPLDEPRSALPNRRELLPATEADRSAPPPPGPGFAIPWRESRELVSADIVSLVRNYRRDGLPLVHLWESQQNRVAIGLNPHGLPGIYYTRHFGD
jgi:hypothetical protein